MTDFLDDKDDEVFFEVGAALRSRDEKIARGVEDIARGEDSSDVIDSLGTLDGEDAEKFEEMRALGAPLGSRVDHRHRHGDEGGEDAERGGGRRER